MSPFFTFKEFANFLKRSESWLYERYKEGHVNFDPDMPPLVEHPCAPRSRVVLVAAAEKFVEDRMLANSVRPVSKPRDWQASSAVKLSGKTTVKKGVTANTLERFTEMIERVHASAKRAAPSGNSLEHMQRGDATRSESKVPVNGKELLSKEGDSILLNGRLVVRPKSPYCDLLMEDGTVIWYGHSNTLHHKTGEQTGERNPLSLQ